MSRGRHIAVFRWLALLSLIPAGCIVLYFLRDELRLQRLAEHDAFLRSLVFDHPVLAFAGSYVAYSLATGASIPAAAGMTVAAGWMFGFWPALGLCSFASTTGACGAFLISRKLLREPVRVRFADRLAEVESALERDGAFYLFLLRLVPVIPFFVINIVMGLTPIRLRTFWWVSQLGMLPGTVLFVAAGASVPTLQDIANQGISGILSLKVIAAFSALGLMPLVARRIFLGRRAWQTSTAPQATFPADGTNDDAAAKAGGEAKS